MQTLWSVSDGLIRLDFNRRIGIPEDKIDFRSACCSPESDGKVDLAVMAVCPTLLKDKGLKGSAVFPGSGCEGFVV
jgi:hypothetical protein